MRIGLVSDYYPPYVPGGSGRSVYHLAHRLARHHHVVVITPRYGSEGDEHQANLHVIRWPFPARMRFSGQALPARWAANPLAYLWSLGAIWRIAQREHLELLHVQDNKLSFVGAVLARRLLRIPLLFTIRDTLAICPIAVCLLHREVVPHDCSAGKMWRECSVEHVERYFQRARPLQALRIRLAALGLFLDTRVWRQRLLQRLDGIVGVSEGILETHRRSGFLPPVPAEVVFNLPPHVPSAEREDVVRWRRELGLSGGPMVLTVGRRTPGKGIPVLYQAAAMVERKLPDALFVVIGSGPEGSPPTNVRMLDFSPHDLVLQYMHVADVVVIPSIWPEPLPRVGLEALACGKPIVGTSVGGIPEVVQNGENGLLVPPREPQQLGAALLRLLRDETMRERMGQRSHRLLSQRFQPDQLMERLVRFYERSVEAIG